MSKKNEQEVKKQDNQEVVSEVTEPTTTEPTSAEAKEETEDGKPVKIPLRRKLERDWIPQCKDMSVFTREGHDIVTVRKCCDPEKAKKVIAEHKKTDLCAVAELKCGWRVGMLSKHHSGEKNAKTKEQQEWTKFQRVLDSAGCIGE